MRKTEEIKLRVTTPEKESWQALAAEANTSVSELIRLKMNQEVDYQHTKTDADVHAPDIDVDCNLFPTEPQCSPGGKVACVYPECSDGSCHPRAEPQANAFDAATVTLNGVEVVPIPILPAASPQPDRVPTSGEVGAKEKPLKPTSDCHNHQCSLKGCASCDYRTTGYIERRTEPCACGKPTYVFCGTCDA